MNCPVNTNIERQSEEVRRGAPCDLSHLPNDLFAALRLARRRFGGNTEVLRDAYGEPLSYIDLIRAAYALGGKIANQTRRGQTIGVILPTVAPSVITLFSLYAFGRTPAIINYIAGDRHIEEACRIANVSHIVTSRRFVAAASLNNVISRLDEDKIVLYLEDLKRLLSPIDKFIALTRAAIPNISRARIKPTQPAAILFTSGTTGAPKGVILSHRNILANIAQCRAHVPFKREWIFFNVLPIFHAFGLTGGTLLPILGGMKTVLYASPLDREQIPLAIQSTGANVLIATDTFARFYARAADDNALKGLRYAVLGGEVVHEDTRELFSKKSSAEILEGYGVTECGPVVAVNHPDRNRPGSAGELLPGMEARLKAAPGIGMGKRLLVRGPNVMLGYRKADGDGFLIQDPKEWFDTGDLAEFDKDGFLFIKGRAKRFARVGAEMASLAAVEQYARSLWPGANHAALAVAQAGGREEIVLVTDQRRADRTEFAAWARSHHAPAFEIPHHVLKVRRFPTLATGKPDYEKIRRLIEKKLGDVEFPARHGNGISGDPGKICST